MKRKLLFISIIFALLFVGCSNLVNELLDAFNPQGKTVAAKVDNALDSVTSAEAADPGIVTVTVNEDGSLTFTSIKPGTTEVTVTADATNPENGGAQTVTLVYEVTVAEDGTVTYNEKSKDIVDHFRENEEVLSPKTDSSMTIVEAAVSNPQDIVTAVINDDGTVSLTAKKVGTTSLTVTGKDSNGDTVTITYSVEVDAYGNITKGQPVVFINQTRILNPTDDSTMTSVNTSTSSPEGIVTVTKNDDGSVTLVSNAAGTTSVTVKGKDSNNDDVTLTYPVTVADDGTITTGSPVVFTNQTRSLNPADDSDISTVSGASSNPLGIVETTVNADGTVKIVSKEAGSTKVTVTGRDSSGGEITVTYTVTVAADGTVTVDSFTNQTKIINPVSDGSLASVISALSDNNSIASVSANADGTYTITSKGEGSTTIRVAGKNADNEDVDVTYAVSVGEDGLLTVASPVTRIVCTITFDVNGGSGTIQPVRWEKNTTYDINVDGSALFKQNHSLTGWATSAGGAAVDSVTVSVNMTLYAVWTPNSLGPTVTLETMSSDANVGFTYENTTPLTESSASLTLSANTGFENYLWKIDGVIVQNGTSNQYVLNPAYDDVTAGYHQITLVVKDSDGNYWSATAVVTVQK